MLKKNLQNIKVHTFLTSPVIDWGRLCFSKGWFCLCIMASPLQRTCLWPFEAKASASVEPLRLTGKRLSKNVVLIALGTNKRPHGLRAAATATVLPSIIELKYIKNLITVYKLWVSVSSVYQLHDILKSFPIFLLFKFVNH